MTTEPDNLLTLAEITAAELCELVQRHGQPGSLKAILLELLLHDVGVRLATFRRQYEPEPVVTVEIAAAEIPSRPSGSPPDPNYKEKFH